MTQNLNDYDIKALEAFKYKLLGLDLDVFYLDTYEEKTSTWSRLNENKLDNHALIHALIEDIKKGQKNCRYQFGGIENYKAYQEIETLLDTDSINHISEELQLNLYDLVGYSHNLRKMLVDAMSWQKAKLLMSLLKRKLNYAGGREYGLDGQIKQLESFYYTVIQSKKFNHKEVIDNFVFHVKNCQIPLSEADLTVLFLKLFPNTYLDLFYEGLGLTKKTICTEIEENYAMIYLSVPHITSCFASNFNLDNWVNMINSHDINFPHFQLLKQMDTVIPILFEKKEGSSQKIMMLFEACFNDSTLFHEKSKLIEKIAQINEKVDIENSLKKEVKQVSHPIKI